MSMPSSPNAGSAEACLDRPQPADSVTRRLVYALALLPIVPAVSGIGVSLIDESIGLGPFDEIRLFHLLFSVLWVVATIAVWRRFILWTLGRKWLTALVSMIPFLQVLYGQPLWDIPSGSCIDFAPEVLRVGQHEFGVSLWVWLMIWIWWGWERLNMFNDAENKRRPFRSMTPTARRLVASIASIPFVFGAFLILGVAMEDLLGVSDPSSEAFALASIVAIVVWVLIWRRSVIWSPTVIRQTVVLALLCFALPVALQFLFWDRASEFFVIVLGCLPVIGWGVWMVVTIVNWPVHRTGPGEGASVPRCLNCGYLLIGLRSTRCPECGDEPTLDELWLGATNPSRDREGVEPRR